MVEKKQKLNALRGMHDIMPETHQRHAKVIKSAEKIAATYGFQTMATPILEGLEVFSRTLGETTDIVSKEMYQFEDKNGESITLRPENTASVMRAFHNQGLMQQGVSKFFYAGAMFRHERPQKGRLRQFHQIGVELIGTQSVQADIEVIACGQQILSELGLEQGIELQLNSLGNRASRDAYRAALLDYFNRYQQDLSDDSKQRLQRNPMRILDSKDKQDIPIVCDAPIFTQYLDDESRQFFDELQAGLHMLKIDYRLNPKLVRGLDYYCHSAFEFVSNALGAQATVMGGGRYDGLSEFMGFAPVGAVGWAAGIERLAMLIDAPAPPMRPIAIIPMGEAAQITAFKLAQSWRQQGVYVEMGYGGNLSKRMKQADRLKASHAVIIGDDELEQQAAQLRNLDESTQNLVPLNALLDEIKKDKAYG